MVDWLCGEGVDDGGGGCLYLRECVGEWLVDELECLALSGD